MRALTGLLALPAGAACAAPLRLAVDGQARVTVVLPAAAPAPLAAAAADLRHYVARRCQVDLPLRTDGQQVPGTGS